MAKNNKMEEEENKEVTKTSKSQEEAIVKKPSRKAGKKKESVQIKKEPDSETLGKSGNSGIPSIEDELRIIEGKDVESETKLLKRAKAKRKRGSKVKKPWPPLKHCNLCNITEAFTSELDLALHLRNVHFKERLVFKQDETDITDAKHIFGPSVEKVDDEHGYAKESMKKSDSLLKIEPLLQSAIAESGNSEADISGSEEQNNKEPVPFVVVRKVKETDKKYCPFCRKLFLSDKGVKEHIEIRCKNVPHRCFCGKGLSYESEPHTHFRNFEIPKYQKKSYSIECNKCKKKFNFKETYENHRLECKEPETANKIENDFECSTCSEVFSDKRSLKKHERSHLPKELRAVCDICGKNFASKAGLVAHRVIHSETKQYICEYCGYGFNQKGNLMTHMKTRMGFCKGHKGVHTLMAECTVCNRSFTSINRLKQHQKHHDRVEELTSSQRLICKDCGKSFKSFPELKRHIMIHTGERPFACTFCNKAFAQKSNMMAHMRIHTGYRPYECYICGQGFTQGTNLKQHVEKNHDIKTYRFKRLPRGRKGRDTNSDEKVIDIEMEYIEKTQKEGPVEKMLINRRQYSRSAESKPGSNRHKEQKDIGIQAEEDEEYLEDDYEEMDSDSDLDKHESKETKIIRKVTPQQKIYLQVVHNQADTRKDMQVSIDPKTLQQVLTKSLAPSTKKETRTISNQVENQTRPPCSTSEKANADSKIKYNTTLPSEEKKMYTVYPKQTEREIAQVIQTVSEQFGNKSGSTWSNEKIYTIYPKHTETESVQQMQTISEQSENRAAGKGPGEKVSSVDSKRTETDIVQVIQSVSEQLANRTVQSQPTQKIYTFYPKHTEPDHVQLIQKALEPETRIVHTQSDEKIYTAYPKSTETDNIHILQTVSDQTGSSSILKEKEEKMYTVYSKHTGTENVPAIQTSSEQTVNRIIQEAEEKTYTILPKSSAANSVTQIIQAVSEQSDNFNEVQLQTVVDTAGDQLLVLQPQTNANHIYAGSLSTSTNAAQGIERYDAVSTSAGDIIVNAENVSALAELEHNQTTIEHVQNNIETYEVTDEESQNIEYVTVIFEDDVDTVEQEIAISQTDDTIPESTLSSTPNLTSQIHRFTVNGNPLTANSQLTAVLSGNTEQERNIIQLVHDNLWINPCHAMLDKLRCHAYF